MVVVALYVLGLASPLLLFALLNLVRSRCRPRPRVVRLKRRRLRQLEIDMQRAVLEAQFIVAPHLALRDARRLLDATAPGDEEAASGSVSQAFELALEALTLSRQGHHVASAR
jgi:hypothetical protein